jgi:O-antigen/teichoic acid export membrane protein
MQTNLPQVEKTTTKTKHIASNTLVLFVRMFAIMLINLYTVRVVLQALGQVDYGLFNTIAGVVLTSTFLTTTLAVSIQRFYSYSIGMRNDSSLPQIFSVSMNIILLLIVIVILIFETFGLWFVNTQLVIPADRMTAAQWTYQLSIVAFLFSFLQIPYSAAFFAHENMGYYALVTMAECAGRLLVALLIGLHILSDGLIFYAFGLAFVAFLTYAAYAIRGRLCYAECRYVKAKDKKLYKDILSFSGWTTYSALSGISIIQGSAILLNIFFGNIATAAYAIANQIYNALTALINSIAIAFRPPMIKSYAEQDIEYLNSLFIVSNKFILYLLIAISLPLMIEIPIILNWWLGTVTEQMIIFSRLYMIFMIILALHNPITTIIHATGKIKYYILLVDSITLLCLPITLVLFYWGLPDYTIFLSMIGVCTIAHTVRLACLKHYYSPFSYRAYFMHLILPCLLITLISILFSLGIYQYFDSELTRFVTLFVFSPLFTFLLVYAIGISLKERRMLHRLILQFIKHSNT